MNRLWNILLEGFFNQFSNVRCQGDLQPKRGEVCRLIWIEFFNLQVDKIPKYSASDVINSDGFLGYLKKWFFTYADWYEIYDLIEFIGSAKIDDLYYTEQTQIKFIEECNLALKKEVAGYRIVNNKVLQIVSEEEILTIEEASSLKDKLSIVSLHLKTGLDLLADRKNPDYRNSIKESISAVESITKIISGNSKDTLAGAIDKIKSKIKIHAALERGFKQIYGYTSDADGIRHGLTEMADCDFEDAKFMLVSCSAFINYLIAKSAKAGITFE
ncbi:hypothetical protein GGD38_003696 [Chitinophagaceae bacterium OAS944]|nr:hypothetical protein [Chitinophagaceae bacterium OAS944]